MLQVNHLPISVLLAEDHDIVRYGVRCLFESCDDLNLVAETSSLTETLTLVQSLCPDVVLMNIALEEGNVIESIGEVNEACSHSKILIFSSSQEVDEQLNALRHGAVGIFSKATDSGLLCKAVRKVHEGDLWISQAILQELWRQNLVDDEKALEQPEDSFNIEGFSPLTKREMEVAVLCAKGLSAKQIGERLFISEKTVRNRLTIIYSKLDVKNQLELTLKASTNSRLLGFCEIETDIGKVIQ